MSKLSLVISPKIMKEVDDSQSMLLRVPPDATAKGTGDTATYIWPEFMKIVDSSVTLSEKDKNTTVFFVKFRIPEDSPLPTVNAGRNFSVWWRVNTEALASGNTENGQYKMSIMSIGRLKSLLRALGFELDEGADVDIAAFFDKNGEEPAPIVGANVYVRMKQKPGKDKDGEQRTEQEPVKFVNESEGNI